MNDRFLAGRTAWVTGGVTGTGRAIAERLAAAGADVAIGSLTADAKTLADGAFTYRPGAAETAEAIAAIESASVRARAFPLDVRDSESVHACHRAAVAELGAIDILVNAAGAAAHAYLTSDESDGVWNTVLDINLNGPYRTTRACLGAMVERGWGRIVNIGSTAGEVGYPRYTAYCASKSGLLGLSRAVAQEVAAQGITCNVIQPGQLDTGMGREGSQRRADRGEGGADWEENLRLIAEQLPQKRLITVDEVAALAVFLCRDEATGITGEVINVAGGALW